VCPHTAAYVPTYASHSACASAIYVPAVCQHTATYACLQCGARERSQRVLSAAFFLYLWCKDIHKCVSSLVWDEREKLTFPKCGNFFLYMLYVYTHIHIHVDINIDIDMWDERGTCP
jgi:hypothetical protein